MANRSRVPLSKRFQKPPKKMTDAQFLSKIRRLFEGRRSLDYITKEAEGEFAAEAAKAAQKKKKFLLVKSGSVKRLKKNKGGTVKRKAISKKKVR